MRKLVLLIMFLCFSVALSAQHPKLTAYYPIWSARCQDANGYGVPPWNLDYTGLTYIVHFGSNMSQTSPYFAPVLNAQDSIDLQWGQSGACGQFTYNWQDSLIKIAHRHGVKVVLSITAVDPGAGFNYVSDDSSRCEVFAYSFVGYLKRKGYDGAELDVEEFINRVTSYADVNRFVRILRRQLNTMTPRGVLLSSAVTYMCNLYYASQDSCFDMHNLQCYVYWALWNENYSANVSWFLTPVSVPTSGVPSGTEINSLDHDYLTGRNILQIWTDAGHDKSKIGIGLGAYGVGFIGVNTYGANLSGKTVRNDLPLRDVKNMLNYGGTLQWYDKPKSPGIAGTATGNPSSVYWWAPSNGTTFYLTYEDETSVRYKAHWADSLGVGGIMIYDIAGDMRPGQTVNSRRTPTLFAAGSYIDSLNGRKMRTRGMKTHK